MSKYAHQIKPTAAEVNALALKLIGEELSGAPGLQAPKDYFDYDANGRRHPMALEYHDVFDAWARSRNTPPESLAAARSHYQVSKDQLDYQLRRREQCTGDMRRLIESHVWYDIALEHLRKLEARIQRNRNELGVVHIEHRRKPKVRSI